MVARKTYLIDTGAWVEYLSGSTKGGRVSALIDAKGVALITAESTIAELLTLARQRNQDFPAILDTVASRSHLQDIYLNVWLDAAQARLEQRARRPKFGIMDALIAALGRALGATIITTDSDFQGLKNVIVV